MAKENKAAKAKQDGDSAGPVKCKFDECKKNQEKFGFCQDHYEWYMSGVIRGDGSKPVDFEQKLSLHQWRKQRKVA